MASQNNPPAPTAVQARISARIEVLLIVWRIREALTSLPQGSADPDLTIRRWNHGIARELWIAISALGLAAATEMAVSTADGAASLRCPPITYLLQSATWDTRRLRFDLFKVNLKTYLSLSNIDPAIFHGLDDSGVYAKWWTWSNDGPGDGKRCPGWWINPSVDVGAPMPVFESEKDDLSATAGDLYLRLGRLSAEKESELRQIDDRIVEEGLEFSR